jgi:hypothetical protein
MKRLLLPLALLLPLLTACENLQRKDQASRLTTSLQSYASTIRWDNLGSAYAFVRPREGTPQPPQRLDGLKVTGYTIRVNSVNETSDEANVTFTFTYYFQDQGRVTTTEQTETWYFDAESGAWFLDAPTLPRFR